MAKDNVTADCRRLGAHAVRRTEPNRTDWGHMIHNQNPKT